MFHWSSGNTPQNVPKIFKKLLQKTFQNFYKPEKKKIGSTTTRKYLITSQVKNAGKWDL